MGAGALAFRAHPSPEGARKLFRGSLLYLPLLLAGMVAHRQPNTQPVTWQALSERVLPDALQPGAVWATLQGLHWPRLRPLEERYAMLLEVQRQMQSVRCPSRAYGDSSSSGSVEEGEGDEQQLQALEGSDNGQAEAGDGGSRNSSSSSSRREAAAQ
jgi:protoheme IX farnesyltransferase